MLLRVVDIPQSPRVVDIWMDGWMDGWMDVRIHGWMDRWMDGLDG